MNTHFFPELSPIEENLVSFLVQKRGVVRSKKADINYAIRAINSGKEKKSKAIYYAESGTRYQRKVAKEVLKYV